MRAPLSRALGTLWSLRRLVVLLVVLPWLVWLPPVLVTGASPLPQGLDGWVLFGWYPVMLALLLRFPASYAEHIALALVLGVAALILPLIEARVDPYRPLTEQQLVWLIVGGWGAGLLAALMIWACLSLLIQQLALQPPMVRQSYRSSVASALPARAAFMGLRHAPMRDTALKLCGQAGADGWFPVWIRHPWERRMGNWLLPRDRSDFIGPCRPAYWARIKADGPLEQQLEVRPDDVPLGKAVGISLLRVEPLGPGLGPGSRITESEQGTQMPWIMALGFWLYDFGASSLRARMDYLEGMPGTDAPHVRTGSPLTVIANWMDPLAAQR